MFPQASWRARQSPAPSGTRAVRWRHAREHRHCKAGCACRWRCRRIRRATRNAIEQIRDLDGRPGGNPAAWAGLISAYILSSAVVALGRVPYFWPIPQWLRHVLVLPLAVGRSVSLDRTIRSTASQTPKTSPDPLSLVTGRFAAIYLKERVSGVGRSKTGMDSSTIRRWHTRFLSDSFITASSNDHAASSKNRALIVRPRSPASSREAYGGSPAAER